MNDEVVKRLEQQTRFMSWLVIAAIVFAMLTGLLMLGITMWNTYRLGQQSVTLRDVAVETHDALCALHDKEERGIQQTDEFLRDNPTGVTDARGEVIISREILERGQQQRRDTLEALRTAGLDCERQEVIG